jgi:flagellar motor protein MotB
MNRISNQNESNVDEENPYWISFSDLMSGLLVIFILAAVALIIELTEQQQKINADISEQRQATKARKAVLYEIRDELLKNKILVEIADNDTVLRIPEKTLSFSSNSDRIPTDKNTQDTVKLIGIALHNAINKKVVSIDSTKMRYEFLDTVFIEGHTDSWPTKREKGNWGLSAFRAISLWDFWNKNVGLSPKFNRMANANGIKLFSVSGYAASRRTQLVEKTAAQRSQNRRIDLRFTIKSPSISELEGIGK